MRGFMLGAALAGAAAVAWFNPGNLMGKLGLPALQPAPAPTVNAATSGGSSLVVKWKDANGNVVFGDANSAPAGSKPEKLKLATPNLVSMPKAPPPSINNEQPEAQPAVEGVETTARPQPRNLALERIEKAFSGQQK